MKELFKIGFWVILFEILMTGCSNHSDNSKTSLDSVGDLGLIDSVLVKKGVVQKLDFAIVNLKSSDDFIKSLSENQQLYDEQLLNNPKNVVEYESSRAKALNVGVYGADLNYIIHFNQIQISFKYLLSAKQLSDQIGVAMAFDKKALDKFNGNIEQKDTLINIVSSAYDVIKRYLKNGEQFQVATLVMTGSWVENMHLTLNVLPEVKNAQEKKNIVSKLSSQQEYALNLMTLLAILNSQNDETISDIEKDLNTISKELVKITPDEKTELPVLNELIAKLRTKIISLK